MNLYERIYYEWNRGGMITRLIMMNVFIFLLVNFCIAVALLFDSSLKEFFEQALAVPTNPLKLIFKPWTIITSGFLHFGLFHILFNMLWLYWIGRILEEYIGARKVLPVYMYGVFAGSFLMILAYNIFPFFADYKNSAIGYGASAGVMAIIWATVALLPNHRIGLLFLGAVPLIYIAAAYSALDLISIAGPNAGGHIAHLGGAIMGYWFIKLYQRGQDLSIGFNHTVDHIVSWFQPKKEVKLKVKRGGKSRRNSSTTTSKTTKTKKETNSISEEAQLNAILDKINEKGYASLSDKEKAFLQKQSQN